MTDADSASVPVDARAPAAGQYLTLGHLLQYVATYSLDADPDTVITIDGAPATGIGRARYADRPALFLTAQVARPEPAVTERPPSSLNSCIVCGRPTFGRTCGVCKDG